MRRLLTTAFGAGLLAASIAAAQTATAPDRSSPPDTGSLPAFEVTVPTSFSLPNGVEVLHLQRDRVPLVEIVMVVRAGGLADPQGVPGLAEWTGGMLEEGAGGRDALTLADELDYLGVSLRVSADWDGTWITLHTPASRLEPALALMADVVLRPDFPDAEWTRVRKELSTDFLQARDRVFSIASFAWARVLFGTDHREGTPIGGSPVSLSAVTLDDIRGFHATQYRPDNTFVAVVGDVDRSTLTRLLWAGFGEWKAEGTLPERPTPAAIPKTKKRKVYLVDKPGAAQSVIAALAHASEDLEPLDPSTTVMNTLLGGSFASRLNQNLREEHGYTYGARSSFRIRPRGGTFVANSAVATDVTAPALRELMNELERILEPPSADEVVRARNYRALSFPGRFETNRGTALLWADARAREIETDRIVNFMENTTAVNAEQLTAAAKREINSKKLSLVIVGDLEKIEEPIRKLKLGSIVKWTVDDLLGPAPAE